MELNAKQAEGARKGKKWFFEKTNIVRRFFAIAGIAGSGKSTMIRSMVESLGIPETSIRYVSFTGAASVVLTNKGNFATTIHKLIYNVTPLKNGKVKFELKEELDSEIQLLIVDEVGQISKSLMEDLLSFNIKTICLGDKEQLGPVKGVDNGILDEPDVYLDEPMRQSLDNPILWLAYEILKGRSLSYNMSSNALPILHRDSINPQDYLDSTQIITGTNRSAKRVIDKIRFEILGLESPFPYQNEKLMCLKNNWDENIRVKANGRYIDIFLVNGLMGYATSLGEYNGKRETFDFSFTPMIGYDPNGKSREFRDIHTDALYFSENILNDESYYLDENKEKYSKMLFNRDIFEENEEKKINRFTFGHAMSVYKSQGSEFDNGIYIDDTWGSAKNIKAQRYTALTRFKHDMLIGLNY